MEITVEKMIKNASNLGGSGNPAAFAKGPSTVDGQWIERSRCMMCMLVPFQIVSYVLSILKARKARVVANVLVGLSHALLTANVRMVSSK